MMLHARKAQRNSWGDVEGTWCFIGVIAGYVDLWLIEEDA
jgi:hypothetical protein